MYLTSHKPKDYVVAIKGRKAIDFSNKANGGKSLGDTRVCQPCVGKNGQWCQVNKKDLALKIKSLNNRMKIVRRLRIKACFKVLQLDNNTKNWEKYQLAQCF